MKPSLDILKGNLALKILALTLAIVLYCALKNETHSTARKDNDRNPFQQSR